MAADKGSCPHPVYLHVKVLTKENDGDKKYQAVCRFKRYTLQVTHDTAEEAAFAADCFFRQLEAPSQQLNWPDIQGAAQALAKVLAEGPRKPAEPLVDAQALLRVVENKVTSKIEKRTQSLAQKKEDAGEGSKAGPGSSSVPKAAGSIKRKPSATPSSEPVSPNTSSVKRVDQHGASPPAANEPTVGGRKPVGSKVLKSGLPKPTPVTSPFKCFTVNSTVTRHPARPAPPAAPVPGPSTFRPAQKQESVEVAAVGVVAPAGDVGTDSNMTAASAPADDLGHAPVQAVQGCGDAAELAGDSDPYSEMSDECDEPDQQGHTGGGGGGVGEGSGGSHMQVDQVVVVEEEEEEEEGSDVAAEEHLVHTKVEETQGPEQVLQAVADEQPSSAAAAAATAQGVRGTRGVITGRRQIQLLDRPVKQASSRVTAKGQQVVGAADQRRAHRQPEQPAAAPARQAVVYDDTNLLFVEKLMHQMYRMRWPPASLESLDAMIKRTMPTQCQGRVFPCPATLSYLHLPRHTLHSLWVQQCFWTRQLISQLEAFAQRCTPEDRERGNRTSPGADWLQITRNALVLVSLSGEMRCRRVKRIKCVTGGHRDVPNWRGLHEQLPSMVIELEGSGSVTLSDIQDANLCDLPLGLLQQLMVEFAAHCSRISVSLNVSDVLVTHLRLKRYVSCSSAVIEVLALKDELLARQAQSHLQFDRYSSRGNKCYTRLQQESTSETWPGAEEWMSLARSLMDWTDGVHLLPADVRQESAQDEEQPRQQQQAKRGPRGGVKRALGSARDVSPAPSSASGSQRTASGTSAASRKKHCAEQAVMRARVSKFQQLTPRPSHNHHLQRQPRLSCFDAADTTRPGQPFAASPPRMPPPWLGPDQHLPLPRPLQQQNPLFGEGISGICDRHGIPLLWPEVMGLLDMRTCLNCFRQGHRRQYCRNPPKPYVDRGPYSVNQ